MWPRVFSDPVNWTSVVEAVAPTIVIAWVAGRIARRGIDRVLRTMLQDTVLLETPMVRAPLRLIAFATFVLTFGVLIVPALEIVGLHPRTGVHLRTLTAWAFDSGLRVLLVAAVAYALIRIVSVSVQRFEADISFGTGLDALERARRARTLGGVLTSVTSITVVAIATLMVLHEFRVDISPALTGAGIVGVALGFGAQTLVKDLIGGFFLILENQVRVGDIVKINGEVGGLVEAINLRTIVLRDENGAVHIIPNGSINRLANMTMQFSYYVVSLPLAYGEDTDRATTLLEQIAEGMRAEDRYEPFMLAPLEVWGVDALEQNAVRLKVRLKTAPLKQWEVGREFLRRVYKALQEHQIELWQAQKTVVTQPRN
jgi:small conductance mechanosensitive channel